MTKKGVDKKKMANYETWEAGTLLVTKQRIVIVRHLPDPWDFQSKNFTRICLNESENFILMSPNTEEEYCGTYYLVFRILHPIHGRTVVSLDNSDGTKVEEYIAPVPTSKGCE